MLTKNNVHPIFAAKKIFTEMSRLIKALWLLSILMFLGGLLYVYANLPQEVALAVKTVESGGWIISRNIFFYGSLSIFIVVNVVLYVFGLILKRLPFPEPKSSYWLSNPELRTNVRIWITSFSFVVNLLLLSTIISVAFINNNNISAYRFFMYFGPALILIWLMILIVAIIRGR